MRKKLAPIDLSCPQNYPQNLKRVVGFKPGYLPAIFGPVKGRRSNTTPLSTKVRISPIEGRFGVFLVVDASAYNELSMSNVSRKKSVFFFEASLSNLPPITVLFTYLFYRKIPAKTEDEALNLIGATISKSAKNWCFEKTSRGVWVSATILGRRRRRFIKDSL